MAKQESPYAKVQIISGVVFVLFAALFLGGLFLSFWSVLPPSPTNGAPAGALPTQTPTLLPTGTATPTSPSGVPTQTPTLTPTTPPGTPGAPIVHVVQRGENLFRIALRYNTTVEAIARANNIVNPRLIYVGQTLLIPSNEPTSQSTNATVAPPTATATPTPTISATATLTQEPTTSTPSLGFIEYISSERFVVFATTCFGAIGALVGLFTFVSTIVLSWQRTSRDLRQFQVEKIELEIEKLRRELEL